MNLDIFSGPAPELLIDELTPNDISVLREALNTSSASTKLAVLRALMLLPLSEDALVQVGQDVLRVVRQLVQDPHPAGSQPTDEFERQQPLGQVLATCLERIGSIVSDDWRQAVATFANRTSRGREAAHRTHETAPPTAVRPDLDEPPSTASRSRAQTLAQTYLQRLAEGDLDFGMFPTDSEVNALQDLDRQEASFLISAFFAALLLSGGKKECSYWAGNSIRYFYAALGRAFLPDIKTLIEIYLEMHAASLTTRDEWYRNKDVEDLLGRHPYFIFSWQVAWTISRVGMRAVLTALDPVLSTGDESTILAAAHLIEDVARYTIQPYPPVFGGGVGPPEDLVVDNALETATWVRPSTIRGIIETSACSKVTVWYGTDRQATGRQDPSRFYGGDRGELKFGVCEVSIPRRAHREGEVERPSLAKLEFGENPKKHFVLLSIRTLSRLQFCTDLKASVDESVRRQVLVFVHGYKVNFEDATHRAAQLAYDLRRNGEMEIDIPIVYSWPSMGRFLGYDYDGESAEKYTIPHFKEFLSTVASESGASRINIIAHSMGNRALTNTLKEFVATSTNNNAPVFREVVLAAPDIDAIIFKRDIAPAILGSASRLTMYASRRDWALWVSKATKYRYQRAGDTTGGNLVIVPGIDTIDASAVDTSLLGHSYFGDSRTIISDLYYLLNEGLAPNERKGLASVEHRDGRYWAIQ